MEKLTGHEGMHSRIRRILSDETKREKVKNDYVYTFKKLGLNDQEAGQLCEKIFALLDSERPLDDIEREALIVLSQTGGIVTELEKKLTDRAERIFLQIKTFASEIKGRVLDYGTGDGQVGQLLQDRLDLQVDGVDIRDYRSPQVSIAFKWIQGGRVPETDNSYAGAVVTNVLHHEAENEEILRELVRVVRSGGRIIILETVPNGENEEDMEADKDRTFMNDYLYNRLFHNADVPVPGTFETIASWRRRFSQHGIQIIEELDLGFDQPTIRDRHYLYLLKNRQK